MRWAILGLVLTACAHRPAATPHAPDGAADADDALEEAEPPDPEEPEPESREGMPPPDPANLTAEAVLRDPTLAGQMVTVDLVESFWDHGHSTAAPGGGYEVTVYDAPPYRLRLRPATRREREQDHGDDQLLAELPRHLKPPVRVVGRVVRWADGVDLVPRSIAKLSFPRPVRLSATEELLRDPAAWSHRYVEVEATHMTGFEASYIGPAIWLDSYPSARVRCPPKIKRRRHIDLTMTKRRVRIVGYAYTRGRYGHLGVSDAMIDATEIVFLDPSRPECR